MKKTKKLKVLLYDIETAPNLGYVWGKYEQNVLSYVEEGGHLCFSYKWLGEGQGVRAASRQGQRTDRALVKKLWKLLDRADVVVAHNGDQFDQKKANARFVLWGLGPPAPYKSVDTKKVAKKYFKFNSNKLDDLGQFLGVGKKLKTGGFELWLGCLAGNKAAWKKMLAYNKQDVRLLEKVYLKLRPWIEGHPNLAAAAGRPDGCPKCGHAKLKSYGWKTTKTRRYVRYRCLSCRGFCHGRESQKLDVQRRN